jgi:hypothetical protein
MKSLGPQRKQSFRTEFVMPDLNPIDPKTFYLGLNMPGAVSAGAYTAGVLDFLREALEAWEAAKAKGVSEDGRPVPRHNVVLEVLSGTSAGGVVSALASLDFLYGPAHTEPGQPGIVQDSRVRRAWVDLLDIRPMLDNSDLKDVSDISDLPSVLNSTSTFDSIAAKLALPQPKLPPRPPYISPSLSLFVTLSNIRGTPYTVSEANQGSPEQRIRYYADQVQFEFLGAGSQPAQGSLLVSIPLQATGSGDPNWDVFRTATKGTGSFPVAFAPQVLERPLEWYTKRLWSVPKGVPALHAPAGEPPIVDQALTKTPIPPDFPDGFGPSFGTVNVDGGVTNNDPFECARGYIATKLLGTDLLHFPREAREVYEAVISIAPFPGTDALDPNYVPAKNKGIGKALSGVLSALIAQSRFTGESLSLLKEGKTFSRFVIAPDAGSGEKDRRGNSLPALQGGSLGAFAGFLSRNFREHDYQLGRRNCQRFLKAHFVLPESNTVLKNSCTNDPACAQILDAWKIPDQDKPAIAGIDAAERWLPVIPLCSKALNDEVQLPSRVPIAPSDLDAIGNLIGARLKVIAGLALKSVNFLVRGVLVTYLSNMLRDKAMKYITEELQNDYSA